MASQPPPHSDPLFVPNHQAISGGPQDQVHPQLYAQDQQQQQLLPTESGTDVVASVAATFQNLGRRLLSPQPARSPKIGFSTTTAMAKAHEEFHRAERALFQFQVTKLRSWRTGYVRLLTLYKDRFCTIDPDTHQVTNTWYYSSLVEWLAMPKENNSILLQVNADKLKFKCHSVDSPSVLSALLECKLKVEGPSGEEFTIFQACSRQTRHGTRVGMSLQVAWHGLCEKHPSSLHEIQTYRFRDIVAVSFTADDNTGIMFHFESGKSRLFFIQSSRRHGNGRSDLVTVMRERYEMLGLPLQIRESCSTQSWLEQRRALAKDQTIVMAWDVNKETKRHDASIVGNDLGWVGGSVNRTLAITRKGYLLELDGGGVVSCRPLHELHALVRHAHTEKLTLEFTGGNHRTYGSIARDTLIVSILDAATTLGKNKTVHVSDVTSEGYSLACSFLADEPSSIFQPISIPFYCLRRVHQVSTAAFAFLDIKIESSLREGQRFQIVEECFVAVEACREFNASVPLSGEGLPKGDTDKTVIGCLGALWGIISKLLKKDDDDSKQWYLAELAATPIFQTIYRLTQTVTGYRDSVELSTLQAALGLFWDVDDVFCQFWALRVLYLLVSSNNTRDMEIEFVNKSIVLRTGGQKLIHGLVATLIDANAKRPDGGQVVSDLILMGSSDILQSILCSSNDTTSPEYFNAFIEALAKGHRALLSTLRSQTPFVIENTALLLHLLSSYAPSAAVAIRDAALSSGILLQHFHAAIFSPLEGQRFLSRFLCSLWLSGPISCDEKRLLNRMIPNGFMCYLDMPILSQMEEEQLDDLERDGIEAGYLPDDDSGENMLSTVNGVKSPSRSSATNMLRLRSRIAITTNKIMHQQQIKLENFRIFFHVLTKDHSLPDLIWNQQTRRELRIALENEIQLIKKEADVRGGVDQIAWNHQQFCVAYPSLDDEVKVGSIYMRLWLQAGDGFIKSWDEPVRLFEVLFRRFLCELDRNTMVTIMCIRCLERLYTFHADRIGAWPDIMIMVRSMASTKNVETQHRLLGLVATLLGVSSDEDRHGKINIPDNAEQLLNVDSIGQLCQFVAWGHTSGAQVGNLMSSTLHMQDLNGSLISSGSGLGFSSMDPSITIVNSAEVKGDDAYSPAVWFVASTARNPPPENTIRGPFRISILKSMVQNGDLSTFDQVTASKVEDYSSDDGPKITIVSEGQIDTGKWRRLDQVWQLRWQLCTDGDSDGIFSPSEVSLLASRALIRLVDLHKSFDSRGVPYFPIPIAKRLLCGFNRDPSQAGSVSETMKHSESYLSILSQALLCNDHRVVEASAQLLRKLIEHNESAMAKFYLTGVYFFACCHTGSNFAPLARLLHDTHLHQHFRSGFAATADSSELPMKERSILGNMLPEGILFILVNYGVNRFSEIFVGNYDTPEVIWNFEMRRHLIEMIHQHLGDFPSRLRQNTTCEYEYCPLPGVAYKRLEHEIFCHNYYLSNLCDEVRFPEWPITEPVEVFRACLDEWKQQMNRDENKEEDAQEEARKVLDLHEGDGEKELRKAYRMLARKFHPDKNPAGRDMFETIQASYELLLPLVASGTRITERTSAFVADESIEGTIDSSGLVGGSSQMQVVHILLKTQILICLRYPGDMCKYKYPAYHMLLRCLILPQSCKYDGSNSSFDVLGCCLIQKLRASFVKSALELVFQTCLVSPLNAEELIAEGGVIILCNLLNFYVLAIDCLVTSAAADNSDCDAKSIASDMDVTEIIRHIVRTIGGVCFYEAGRSALLAMPDSVHNFGINWRKCVEGINPNSEPSASIKRFALEGVANMARSSELQELLVGCGIVWPMLHLLLGYDPTLDEGAATSVDQDDMHQSQAACNNHARLSARGLGMLCGLLTDPGLTSPKNDNLCQALSNVLTPSVARLLRNKRTGDLLQTLNSNTETPLRIWNLPMRQELEAFLSTTQREREGTGYRSVDEELKTAKSKFEYVSLKGEVTIGGVYLRVFNSWSGDRKSIQEIPDLYVFAKQVLNAIASSMNRSLASRNGRTCLALYGGINRDSDNPFWNTCELSDTPIDMAMKTLQALVCIDELVDNVFCETEGLAPPILMSMLELDEPKVFDVGCDILSALSNKHTFANAVAAQGSIWRLLVVLECADEADGAGRDSQLNKQAKRRQKGWSIMESMTSSPSIAQQLLRSTAWLELLGLVAGYQRFSKSYVSRQGAAKTLSRLLWDPQTGATAAPQLGRFLPVTLTVVLKEEGPDSFLKAFDNESETPELIWDSDMRSELRSAIGEILDKCLERRVRDDYSVDDFELRPHYRVVYKKLQDELFVGGVYVRLYLKDPTFSLRDPTSFLERLLHRWTYELDILTSRKSGVASICDGFGNELSSAQQDRLELVTSASVYLCKIRVALCDKLSEWGFMAKSIYYLQCILALELLGSPLLSVIRLLHIAANRLVNVEALAIAGSMEGEKGGIIDCTKQAIKKESLHNDCAFMIEMLKNLFKVALGDLTKVQTMARVGGTGFLSTNGSIQVSDAKFVHHGSQSTCQYMADKDIVAQAMAPSPAPGVDPVNSNRVRREKTLDDPLMAFSVQSIPHGPIGAARGNAGISGNQRHEHPRLTPQQGMMVFSPPQALQEQNRISQTVVQHDVSNQIGDDMQRSHHYQVHDGYQQQMIASPYSVNTTPAPVSFTYIQQAQTQESALIPQEYGSGYRQLHPGVSHPSFQPDSHNSYHHMQRESPQSYSKRSAHLSTQNVQAPTMATPPQLNAQKNTQRDPPLLSTPSGFQQQPQESMIAGYNFHGEQKIIQQPLLQCVPGLPSSTVSHLATDSQHNYLQRNNDTAPGLQGQKQPQPLATHVQDPTIQQGQIMPSQQFIHYYQQTQVVQEQQPGQASQHGLQYKQQTVSMYPQHSEQIQHGVQQHPKYQQNIQPVQAQSDTYHSQQLLTTPSPQVMYPTYQPQQQPSMTQLHQQSQPLDFSLNTSAPFLPTSTDGTGIDARTTVDPNLMAEQNTISMCGAPGSAQGRVPLLRSALSCKLAEFLVNEVLEDPSLATVKNPAAAKVHAMELLILLSKDPGFGMKFNLILDEIPAWKKYKFQDHSLFISGVEQRKDYFLTGSSSGEESKKLLKQN